VIIDSSAVVAVMEVYLVLRPSRAKDVDECLREAEIELAPFDAAQLQAAQRASASYGKGTGHPAQLNFGDCMAYALAKVTGEPLLFKGDHFVHTDVEPAHRA